MLEEESGDRKGVETGGRDVRDVRDVREGREGREGLLMVTISSIFKILTLRFLSYPNRALGESTAHISLELRRGTHAGDEAQALSAHDMVLKSGGGKR